MDIRKLEEADLLLKPYTERVKELAEEISGKVGKIEAERVKELAELCYKEGYMDGYRFADWLHENEK